MDGRDDPVVQVGRRADDLNVLLRDEDGANEPSGPGPMQRSGDLPQPIPQTVHPIQRSGAGGCRRTSGSSPRGRCCTRGARRRSTSTPGRSPARAWSTATDDVLFACSHDGAPLTADHGGPLRLVLPSRYAWKSVKWVTGVRFLDHDVPGYWEARGYHNVADPFLEQRYS